MTAAPTDSQARSLNNGLRKFVTILTSLQARDELPTELSRAVELAKGEMADVEIPEGIPASLADLSDFIGGAFDAAVIPSSTRKGFGFYFREELRVPNSMALRGIDDLLEIDRLPLAQHDAPGFNPTAFRASREPDLPPEDLNNPSAAVCVSMYSRS